MDWVLLSIVCNLMRSMSMAQVISAVQEKGGAGKSTMVSCIAGLMENEGVKTLIIDTDNQSSAANWANKGDLKNVDVLRLTDADKLRGTIELADDKYDVILIDTAGFGNDVNSRAIVLSDLILIPAGHNESTMERAAKAYRGAEDLTKDRKRPAEIRLVLWNVKTNTAVFKACKAFIDAKGMKYVDYAVPSLVGFENMTFNGGLPDGRAASAIREFLGALQIEGLLNYNKTELKEVSNG